MIDGHHPNQRGYLIIGKLIAQEIKDVFAPSLKNLHTIDNDEVRELFDIDDEKLFNIYISRGRWFARLSTWRYDPVERLSLSEEFFSKAMALDQSRYEPYLGLAMVNFLRKDVPKAQTYLSKAKNIDERAVNIYLNEYWVRAIINHAQAN